MGLKNIMNLISIVNDATKKLSGTMRQQSVAGKVRPQNDYAGKAHGQQNSQQNG